MEEKENKEDENKKIENEILKETLEEIKERREFYKKAWKTRIVMFSIGIFIIILVAIVIASKH